MSWLKNNQKDKVKLLLITNIIAPYRIPVWNYIARADDFDFKVIALAETEKNREWKLAKKDIKFDYKTLPGIHSFFCQKEWPIHLNIGLGKILFSYKPDIIITSGYDSLVYWEAFLYCKIFKKIYFMEWDNFNKWR